MQFHSIAKIFPLMDEEELNRLADDIKEHGLLEPICLYEGKVLDGRNRSTACTLSGVKPRYREFKGSRIEAIEFVWSYNRNRRHLNSSQSAVAESERAKLIEEYAAEVQRMKDAAKEKKKSGKADLTQSIGEGSRHDREVSTQRAKLAGTNRQYIHDADSIRESHPALFEEIKEGKKTIPQAKREIKRAEVLAKLEDISSKEAKAIEGVYDVIVIDPPWPMEKIERDCRPNQSEFEYPTMSEQELAELHLPCDENCHVWIWTTHRFIPMALRLCGNWRLKYCCMFVWSKPGGFQPVGLPQFNCEFVLYARRGSPLFSDTKAFNTCFSAPRGRHSEKPEQFYETLRRATAGRRIDMFSRRKIEGFDGWGNEL